MVDIAKLSRPRRGALFATALGIVGISTLQLLSDNGVGLLDHLDEHHWHWDGHGHVLPKVAPKINLHGPYAHFKGPIERPLKNRRTLSTYAEATDGSGEITCQTTPVLGPDDIPQDVEYQATVIAGYPGADKRVVMRQMEFMTTLSGRDAWDFKFLGMTKQPYVKTNYPHHEGIWGWEDIGDQVVLVVRNIRHTIDEYHDILSDINYAKTWVEATEMIPRLYKGELREDAYTRWRDERTSDEIGWYGWLIDYWMEGGILRDYFDHKLTTKEHWEKLREPETYTYGELQWDVNICETDPLPTVEYDEICDPTIMADCKAKLVVSAERLMDITTGYEENHKIGELLNQTAGVNQTLIDEVAWDCIYDLLIGNNTDGAAPENTVDYDDYRVREGLTERKHIVSTRHLNKMIQQLTRLINKYSAFDPETGIDWTTSEQAQFLVVILTEHRAEIQAELAVTPVEQDWAHPPKPNWVVFPMCGAESRRVWDYNYPHDYSGLVVDMFPDVVL